jgi:hypothetical protein
MKVLPFETRFLHYVMLRITSVEMTDYSLGLLSERSAEARPVSARSERGG